MAIIIPSKNTYNTNNPKVRDNNVGNVSVTKAILTPNGEYEVVVHTEKLSQNTIFAFEETNNAITSHIEEWDDNYDFSCNYADIKATYAQKTFAFNRLGENSYVSTVLYGVDNENKPRIKYSLYYDKNEYDIQGILTFDGININGEKLENPQIKSISRVSENPTKTTSQYGEIPNPTFSHNGTLLWQDNITVRLTNQTNIANENIVTFPNDTVAITGLIILSGLNIRHIYKQYPYGELPISGNTVYGTETEYIPKSLKITIYGDIISIDLTDGTITYGSGGKPLTLSGNELIQDNATTYGTPTTRYLANRVISEYANGKETATVLVSVSEYYDENGELVISTKQNDLPMTFRIGDLVIPQVYGADGVDRPMSRYKDGSPKIFRVVGRKPYFDGAVWQELSLQEFDKANLS